MSDKIAGGFLALACGDALGAPAEFLTQSQLRARWGTLTEMVGGGVWAPGEWTDDTGMALCVAEGILASPEDPILAIGARFLEWQKTAKDVGSTIRAALSAYQARPDLHDATAQADVPPSNPIHGAEGWAAAARSTPQAQNGLAAGNGSLMRTLPVALAYRDMDMLLRTSARVSAMTHWDPQAEVCCALYCLAIHELLQGAALQRAWYSALQSAQALIGQGSPAAHTPGPSPLPPGFWERLSAVESQQYDQLQPGGYAGYVVDCLEAAVWCCLNAESLEQALVLAVNLAGEADTIAAVAGGLAGAAWGRSAIPPRWLEALYQRERIVQTSERLAGLRATASR